MNTTMPKTISEPPRWLWLATPILLYVFHYVAVAYLEGNTYNRWFASEGGITEELTVIALLPAMVLGLLAARTFYRRGVSRLAAWFLLFALGCLYFAGEEASWGQHWFGWSAPDSWQGYNDQNETNLHNTGTWIGGLLDQLPRNLLSLAALVAGGIMPLWRRWRGRTIAPTNRVYWLLPTAVCVPAGLLGGLATVPEDLQELVWGTLLLDPQLGEVKELMLGWFLLVYALSVFLRLRAHALGNADHPA